MLVVIVAVLTTVSKTVQIVIHLQDTIQQNRFHSSTSLPFSVRVPSLKPNGLPGNLKKQEPSETKHAARNKGNSRWTGCNVGNSHIQSGIYIYMHMHICMLRQGGAGRLETLNPQGLMLRASRHM